MTEQMGWVYKVDQQKAPLRIKQRVFQMGEYIGGTISDFWLSYLAIRSCLPPGAGTVHHGFWRLGTAGRCIRGCGGCQPERKDHPVHPQQGTQPGSG